MIENERFDVFWNGVKNTIHNFQNKPKQTVQTPLDELANRQEHSKKFVENTLRLISTDNEFVNQYYFNVSLFKEMLRSAMTVEQANEIETHTLKIDAFREAFKTEFGVDFEFKLINEDKELETV